jgi:hypothetical protein
VFRRRNIHARQKKNMRQAIALVFPCATQSKDRIFKFLAPFVLAVGFVLKMVRLAFFSWWFDPFVQRRSNRALLRDVESELDFLFPYARVVHQRRTAVLPFDYAEVQLIWGTALFTICRGRGELNVTVAPSHAATESYDLGRVIAALEKRHLSERDSANDLVTVAKLLRPHLTDLSTSFSESEYPKIRQRL